MTKNFVRLRLGESDPDSTADEAKISCTTRPLCDPQLFAMLDAAGLLWNARRFYNPADCARGSNTPELGEVDDMHYWCRTLTESFLYARQRYADEQRGSTSRTYEFSVKRSPRTTSRRG